MYLRLCRACTDGTPGDQVSEVLRRDGIEELRADGNAQLCEVAQKLAGDAETLVDFEGAVKVGVVDQTFPADSRPGFLCSAAGISISYYRGAGILTSLWEKISADGLTWEKRRRRTSRHA